jgi:hypothetical protein
VRCNSAKAPRSERLIRQREIATVATLTLFVECKVALPHFGTAEILGTGVDGVLDVLAVRMSHQLDCRGGAFSTHLDKLEVD